MGKSAGKGGYNEMAAATDRSAKLQKEMFDKGVELQQPWLQAGGKGLTALMDRLGIDGGRGDLLQTFSGQNLTDDPSYNFRFNEGQKAAERALAAQGRFLTPAATKALQRYGQDMASQEYGNAYNRFVNDQSNIYNRLAGLSGVGQQQAGAISGMGQNYANTISDMNAQQANAYANMKASNAAARNSFFNTLIGAGATLAGAKIMAPASSDIRLKHNIVYVGEEKGHKIYEFSYLNDNARYRGVMAQDVLETHPEAVVVMPDGMYAVDYGMLGLNMERVEDGV